MIVNDRELAVASTLVDALAERFDPSKYHDHYREALGGKPTQRAKSASRGRKRAA